MHGAPRSSTSVFRMTLIRDVLISARPPHFIAASTSADGAARIVSQKLRRPRPSLDGANVAARRANARALFTSVVFWDRMVPTSESRTHFG